MPSPSLPARSSTVWLGGGYYLEVLVDLHEVVGDLEGAVRGLVLYDDDLEVEMAA